jgi:tRNA(Ile2) C34 agmatinyltransferase TiaS
MKITKIKTRKEKAAEYIQSLRSKAKGQFYDGSERFYLTLMQDPKTKWTEPCPFCGRQHKSHGLGPGHRVAHCDDRHIFTNDQGEVFDSAYGYIIEVAVVGNCR